MSAHVVNGHRMLVGIGLLVGALAGCSPAAPASPTTAPAAATAAPSAAVKPASPVAASPSPSPATVASPSPGIALSPSPAASPSASPAANAVAPRPANASVKITAPTAGQSVPAGSVQVTIDYSGPPLVAAASATKLDDYHVHYFLDESATPYLGTTVPVPAGNPRIVHTAANQVTFDNVTAGTHTVVVMLSGSNHISVNPPISDQVSFTVS